MAEPRKIVLILGNGFDLDLGLKTSYKDFWESKFCPKDYPAPLIAHLNEKWGDDLDGVKWYDLENEFLNYYNSIPDPSIGIDIITEEEKELLKRFTSYGFQNRWFEGKEALLISLINKGVLLYNADRIIPFIDEHLKEDALNTPIWRDNKAFNLIKEGLCKYIQSVSEEPYNGDSVALAVLYAANYSREAGDFLNIYTFNYTSLPVDYGKEFRSIVHYVHGDCKKGNIIIGTRDDGVYDKNYDFFQKSFDPGFNPPALVADLLDADEVIIFGHSIGENDRQYFKSFFKQQTDYVMARGKDITIFTWDDHSEVEIKRSLQKMTDNNLSTLYGLNHVKIIKTSLIKEKPESLNAFLSKLVYDKPQLEVLFQGPLRSDG